MSWARFDDRYHDNRKIKRAWKGHPRAVGLHAMAVTYCAMHETDGLVDSEWLEDKLPARSERQKVTAILVEVGLFVELPDGDFRINDYLEFNESKVDASSRRSRDAARKAKSRDGSQVDSARSHSGQAQDVQPESSRSPSDPSRAGAFSRPDPTRPDPTVPSRRQAAEAESSPEVSVLCDLLAHLMLANDPKAKVAPESAAWRKPARLLLEKDERPFEEAQKLLRWCQSDSFWRSNVLSMEKFREKYGQLLLKAQERAGASDGRALSSHQAGMQQARRFMEMAEQAGRDAA